MPRFDLRESIFVLLCTCGHFLTYLHSRVLFAWGLDPSLYCTRHCHKKVREVKESVWVGLFTCGSVYFAYGWSSLLTGLLTLENRFGLFSLRWKIGLVFFTYGSPPNRKLDLVFFTYGFPHRK